MFDKERATELLLSLLKAESEPQMSKEPVIDVVLPILKGMGLDVNIHNNNGNPAIFACKGEPKVMLSGHLDTVTMGGGWTRGHGEVDGDRVYGRGALDMKGPCVSLLLAAEKLVYEGVDVAIAFTTDEEVGMMGAKEIVARHPVISDIPLIIVCEPTGFRPVVEEKGIVQMRVRVRGKSAHASMPELGVNAVESLIGRLQNLRDLECACSASSTKAANASLTSASGDPMGGGRRWRRQSSAGLRAAGLVFCFPCVRCTSR